MKNSLLSLVLLSVSLTSVAHADEAAIQKSLSQLGMEKPEITASPIAGLKTVITGNNEILYVSEDGKYVLQGPLLDISSVPPKNITNQLLLTRMDALQDQMIIYKAAKEKHVITVFTDITCAYCHRLHEEMKQYNDLGITVRYLAFPRQGLNSSTEKEMQSIWCAKDRNKAFDAVMNGGQVSPATCDIDIGKQYNLGVQFGIQGTPAIVLQDGTLLPGYQSAESVAKILDAQASTPAKK